MLVTNPDMPKTDEVMDLIVRWTQPLVDDPAFQDLRRSRIRSMMDWIDDWPSGRDGPNEVVMPPLLDQQHDVVMKFFNLRQAHDRLRQSEFYFRRYPFRASQVSKHEHLETVCTMFFFGFYVFEERMDKYLNALIEVTSRKIDVAKALKLYRKRFKEELDARHLATHTAAFEDRTIESVMLQTLLSLSDEDRKSRMLTAAYAYRKASREWSDMARRRAAKVGEFLEMIAEATLSSADFLRTPPAISPGGLVAR